MKVPFYGLDREFRRYREKYLSIADGVWSSGRVLQGSEVAALESTVAEICGRGHAVAVGSCTDALAFALMAHGIGAGDEVLVTSYSFVASVSPILRVGAVPRFVDIEPDHYMMDLDSLAGGLTERTRALLAVDLFGQSMPVEEVERFARTHGLILIEDAAQALGSYDGARQGGSIGHTSCLSFDPTKVVGSFSSAGALLTDDPEIAEQVRMLRYHGRGPVSREYELLGYNSQLASDMAGILCYKLTLMNEWERARVRIAETYAAELSDLEQVKLPFARPGSHHIFHKFVMRAERRDELKRYLQDRGIDTMIHYPMPLCDLANLRTSVPHQPSVPVARATSKEVLSLPIFPELTEDEVQYVAAAVRAFYAPHSFPLGGEISEEAPP